MAEISIKIYQIKIQLEGSKPPIWRRLLVRGDTSLAMLHEIIQCSMGWMDCHLHLFEKDGVAYGPSDSDPDPYHPMKSEVAKLSTILKREKDTLRYEYDFGDGWSHKIQLEKIIPMDPLARYPVCVKGVRSCPPEDCGGVWGYIRLQEVLADPEHEEYDELLEWVGEYFSPEEFDINTVNQFLQDCVR
ncbi:MAG: plasmid pRiA4b ORF-3 family protein [Proteobacteria bacterium]|nr:plasmid pRiA4b ORF-3 family protein [Pseudomonadota bacterium]